MDYIDYYKILGIEKNATTDEIKKAYRKLARKHHPDLNPNNPEAVKLFQQINEANEVLSDPESRKKFDQYGKDWKHAEQFEQANKQQQASSSQNQGNPFGGGEYFSGDDGDYSDFFSSMFGNRGGGRQAKFKGQDFRASVQLNLTDASKTQKQTFTVNGKNIRITVPAGIENGQEIKLAGYGAPGANGGPNGDLFITFEINNNTPFTRKGKDLYTNVSLDLYKALLGGEEMIDTLDGKVKMTVAPETQNGTKVRLKGKGFPVYKKEGEFGDLYVTYQIQLPTGLTAKEKELIEQLSKERKTN
ncbi:DnaJ C-terminal domain-containing protein [Fluviicola taffensis]|uniref:Chaperone DnaJ domain protein n=1 Tax=Fluviicola taffensis (strain DSM 16823 / NCIMB 13979 / RW262) TaxID=755732 RepID=F2IGR1_FLUTR|nr:DnaJ C-terminal domain-containing protein [Fluviicola taffensis]AEA43678.1 chaperone DnaJ domain protein [Fluviicola taffensis DSM 16823]